MNSRFGLTTWIGVLFFVCGWWISNVNGNADVPNPTASIHWTDSGGYFDLYYSISDGNIWAQGGAVFNSITDIEMAYNNGRRTEETQLGLPNGTYGTFDLPDDRWLTLTPQEQAFIIINDERVARGILPLEAIDPFLTQLSIDYATHLVINNIQGHVDVNGRTFQDRINNDIPINNCYEIGGGENIAYYPAAAVSVPIELSIYQFVYTTPSQGSWYHRAAILAEMNESINGEESEGYLGVGVAISPDYLYPEMGGGTAAVFTIIDPRLRNHGNCPWPIIEQEVDTVPLAVALSGTNATRSPLHVILMSIILISMGTGYVHVTLKQKVTIPARQVNRIS